MDKPWYDRTSNPLKQKIRMIIMIVASIAVVVGLAWLVVAVYMEEPLMLLVIPATIAYCLVAGFFQWLFEDDDDGCEQTSETG